MYNVKGAVQCVKAVSPSHYQHAQYSQQKTGWTAILMEFRLCVSMYLVTANYLA